MYKYIYLGLGLDLHSIFNDFVVLKPATRATADAARLVNDGTLRLWGGSSSQVPVSYE